MPMVMLIFLAFILVVGGAAVLAFVHGILAGDRPGDTTVEVTGRSEVYPMTAGGQEQPTVTATVHNPDAVAVMVGLSVRARSVRSLAESGPWVRVPLRTTRRGLLAGRHAVVGVVEGGEKATWAVPIPGGMGSRPELVAVIGQRDRLRVIQQVVPRLTADLGIAGVEVMGPRTSFRRRLSRALARVAL